LVVKRKSLVNDGSSTSKYLDSFTLKALFHRANMIFSWFVDKSTYQPLCPIKTRFDEKAIDTFQ
jgi:hypothetical protein